MLLSRAAWWVTSERCYQNVIMLVGHIRSREICLRQWMSMQRRLATCNSLPIRNTNHDVNCDMAHVPGTPLHYRSPYGVSHLTCLTRYLRICKHIGCIKYFLYKTLREESNDKLSCYCFTLTFGDKISRHIDLSWHGISNTSYIQATLFIVTLHLSMALFISKPFGPEIIQENICCHFLFFETAMYHDKIA
jgi:hypothetical protein